MYVQLQTAMEQVSNQLGQLTVQLSVATITELEVTVDDVPGVALGCKLPDKLKVLIHKWWLACWGASQTGLKTQFIQRLNEYIQSGIGKNDTDKGVTCKLNIKKRWLGPVPSSSGLPPLAQDGDVP